MKFSEAKTGRLFVLRLYNGEILHKEIEKFAKMKNISCASVSVVGGIDKGSILIVGPNDGYAEVIEPMQHIIENVCEVTGTGTIFPNENDLPVLHMHIAAGRKDKTITGCIRAGVKVWLVMEVIVQEIINCSAKRKKDIDTTFELMTP
jgi:predicted DNA-binding protein with PD1-like motif